MAKTVNGAFDEFRQNYVDLDPKKVASARCSRDNLLENIKEFEHKKMKTSKLFFSLVYSV